MSIILLIVLSVAIISIIRSRRQADQSKEPVADIDFYLHRAKQKIKSCKAFHETEIEFIMQRKILCQYQKEAQRDVFRAAMGELWAFYYNKLVSFQTWNQ